jgi:hypothetical protein
MTRFMLAHLPGGRWTKFNTEPRNHAAHARSGIYPIPGAQPIALGLFRSDYKGHRVIDHSGDGEPTRRDEAAPRPEVSSSWW